MNKFYLVTAAAFAFSILACNSAVDQSSDTTADSGTHAADSPHAQMETPTVEALPGIPAGAKVSFKSLKNGQTVTSPLTIDMVAEKIKVDSAGLIRPSSGHHHLLINAGDSMMAGSVIPMDSAHLHFGKAQKKAEVKLPPGKHQLTLQFADGIHRSYGGTLASTVTVIVK